MGKKKAAARDAPSSTAGAASAVSAAADPVRSSSSSAGGRQRSSEGGLCVRTQPGGMAYLSGLTFVVVVLAGVSLAVAPTLPRLLCHWSWVLLTLFGGCLVGCRWAKAEGVAAYLVFWGLLMVHGLCWITLMLVPAFGVLPGSLWRAFDGHGGDHLAIGSLGSVPVLLAPPCLLLAFMWVERPFLAVVYHDVFYAMENPVWNLIWQLLCPMVPLAIWAALLRPPLFSDLPLWPGTPAILAACALANGPAMYYVHVSTMQFRGAAHWFRGGQAAVCLSF